MNVNDYNLDGTYSDAVQAWLDGTKADSFDTQAYPNWVGYTPSTETQREMKRAVLDVYWERLP